MIFQKDTILKKLENHNWIIKNTYIPTSEDDITEVINLTKWNTEIFLWFLVDPTSGYLHNCSKKKEFKLSSSDFTALISSIDPILDSNRHKNIISELHLGNKWSEGLDKFLNSCNEYSNI